ncbi:hypothetical protein TNCV_242551 [Trichonephila clavipes]|uniref:Uncharacterized protein n=1 Tax=Trichonephila clavipes TaxID=2585209 RepID=A0A8X6W443_TRICX|nr:hypothetical protein TNCV_242551 [Trichonephila clavipes]
MITELSSCDGTILFRICRSLQEQGYLPSSRTGCRLLWRCCTAGPPNIPCSVAASATSSGRHTHMITELSSCDGTILFRICRNFRNKDIFLITRTGCRLL